MKKLLVTGAAGFIGYFTAKRLLDDGFDVIGLDNINDYYNSDLKFARLKELGIDKDNAKEFYKKIDSEKYDNFKFIRMNLEDRKELQNLFKNENFDTIIALAAQAGVRYSLENPEAYVDSNIVGFFNILEACRHNNISHLVYASSSSIYGENKKVPFEETDCVDRPVSLYAATKKSNELMAYTYSHLYKIPITGLRFFTVYGPWGRPDMAPMLFASAISENKPIKVFNYGELYRDFTYIDDIIEGILVILKNPPVKFEQDEEQDSITDKCPYQLFNIGNGIPVYLKKFIEIMEEKMGKTTKKIFLEMQSGDVHQTWANTDKLNALGYKSKTNIEQGIDKFVRWFKDFYLPLLN